MMNRPLPLAELAARLEAELSAGAERIEIRGAASLEEARPGDICYLENPKLLPKVLPFFQ